MLISAATNPLKANNSLPLQLTMRRIALSISFSGVLGLQILNPQVLQLDVQLGRLDTKGEILKC